MTDLEKLAARVEALDGRSLSNYGSEVREIYVALGAEQRKAGFDYFEGRQSYLWYLGNKMLGEFLPEILTSLDAAMTLVPEGWAIETFSFWPVPDEYKDADDMLPPARVSLVECSPKRFGRKTLFGHGGTDARASTRAATPAFALTAAALRALAAQTKEKNDD